MVSARRARGWRCVLAFTLAFGCWKDAKAQSPRANPVEALRQTLVSDSDRATRGADITARVAALKSLNDLHHALFLREWRDHHPDPEVALVDQKYRALVGKRFEQMIRPVLRSTDKGLSLRALEQLDGIAAAEPDGCDPCRLMPAVAADLAELTRRGQGEVREAAAKVLGRWHADPEVAVPALGTLLLTGATAERVAAAGSLAQVIEEAARLVAQPNNSVDVALARRNLILAARGAVPALARGVKDKDPEVRRLCLEGLTAVAQSTQSIVQAWSLAGTEKDPQAARRQAEKCIGELLPLVRQINDQEGGCLPATLNDPELQVRIAALHAVEELAMFRAEWLRQAREFSVGDDPLQQILVATLPALSRNLNDRDVNVRRSTLEVLEVLGSTARPAAANVVRSLNDPDVFVRWAAARAMGHLAPAEAATAVPALVKLLSETDSGLRLTAVAALERYGPAAKDAAPALVIRLRSQDNDLRRGVVRALGSIAMDSETASRGLNEALKDPSEIVRKSAGEALERLQAQRKDPGGLLSYHRPPIQSGDR
ncbi:MAG: HEAT repeat domain-containing protein [Gemmataceae bacterium]